MTRNVGQALRLRAGSQPALFRLQTNGRIKDPPQAGSLPYSVGAQCPAILFQFLKIRADRDLVGRGFDGRIGGVPTSGQDQLQRNFSAQVLIFTAAR